MEPDPLSWRIHWRLMVVAAILAAVCWGRLIYWRQGQLPTPVIYGSLILASPTP